jgi:hypothetical protein
VGQTLAGLYVVLLSMTVLALFRQGRWQSIRVIGAGNIS